MRLYADGGQQQPVAFAKLVAEVKRRAVPEHAALAALIVDVANPRVLPQDVHEAFSAVQRVQGDLQRMLAFFEDPEMARLGAHRTKTPMGDAEKARRTAALREGLLLIDEVALPGPWAKKTQRRLSATPIGRLTLSEIPANEFPTPRVMIQLLGAGVLEGADAAHDNSALQRLTDQVLSVAGFSSKPRVTTAQGAFMKARRSARDALEKAATKHCSPERRDELSAALVPASLLKEYRDIAESYASSQVTWTPENPLTWR